MGTAPLARHPLALGEEERRRLRADPGARTKPGDVSLCLLGCLKSEYGSCCPRVVIEARGEDIATTTGADDAKASAAMDSLPPCGEGMGMGVVQSWHRRA